MSDLYQIEQPAVKTQEAYSAISRPSLRANLSRIRRDETLFHYTWLALLVKSIVFLGLVNNDGVHFNLIKAFQLFTNQPFFMIYICVDFLFKGKLHYWTLVFCNFLLSFVMIVDLMNFRAFSNFISVYVLFQASNLENLSGSIISMSRPVDLVFGIDLILLILAGYKLAPKYKLAARSIPIFLMLSVASITYIFGNHLVVDVLDTNTQHFLFSC